MTISPTVLIIVALFAIMLIVLVVREVIGLSNANETLTRQLVAYMTAFGEVDANVQTMSKKIDEEMEQTTSSEAEEQVCLSEAEEQVRMKEITKKFKRNARKAFGKGYATFNKRVKKGMENGLNIVLEGSPSVRDYIFENPNGPILLNEILINKDSFFRIMSRTTNPVDAVTECSKLVHEIQTRKANLDKQEADINPRTGKPYKTSKAHRDAMKRYQAKRKAEKK